MQTTGKLKNKRSYRILINPTRSQTGDLVRFSYENKERYGGADRELTCSSSTLHVNIYRLEVEQLTHCAMPSS